MDDVFLRVCFIELIQWSKRDSYSLALFCRKIVLPKCLFKLYGGSIKSKSTRFSLSVGPTLSISEHIVMLTSDFLYDFRYTNFFLNKSTSLSVKKMVPLMEQIFLRLMRIFRIMKRILRNYS